MVTPAEASAEVLAAAVEVQRAAAAVLRDKGGSVREKGGVSPPSPGGGEARGGLFSGGGETQHPLATEAVAEAAAHTAVEAVAEAAKLLEEAAEVAVEDEESAGHRAEDDFLIRADDEMDGEEGAALRKAILAAAAVHAPLPPSYPSLTLPYLPLSPSPTPP